VLIPDEAAHQNEMMSPVITEWCRPPLRDDAAHRNGI